MTFSACCEVSSRDEGDEMAAKMIVAIMVIPMNGGLFQRAVAWRGAYRGREKLQ